MIICMHCEHLFPAPGYINNYNDTKNLFLIPVCPGCGHEEIKEAYFNAIIGKWCPRLKTDMVFYDVIGEWKDK